MKKLFVFIGGLILLYGCAHTNELAKYDLTNQKVIYQESVLPEAQTINVQFSQSTSSDKKDEKKDDKKESTLLNVLTDIGTGILSGDKVDKLTNAVKTDHLIDHVSNGMRETMVNFMNVEPVEEMSDDPAFIIKSVLQDCELIVSEKSISVRVQAEATIYDRNTGSVVWSNIETDIIPVTSNSLTSDLKTNSNESKILGAIQFASLSDEKVDQLVGQAAETVGNKMAEQLREDYADSKKKK